MNLRNMLVTGETDMIRRHHGLFEAIQRQRPACEVQYLPVNSILLSKTIKKIVKPIVKKIPFLANKRASTYRKNPSGFARRSQETEQKIRALEQDIDLVFHIYGMLSPFWDNFYIPYVVYLDYTMALADRNWKPWAPFNSEEDFQRWLEYEKKSYSHAKHIFTKSERTRQSVIQDYHVDPDKVSVVYSSGNFIDPYKGEKTFGSHRILFNGSDFERKGGNILLEAFRLLRKNVPDAKLAIVGDKIPQAEAGTGIENLGHVGSKKAMTQLCLESDLVVSPAYSEPLGLFLVEAMNYGIPCIVSNQDGMPEIIRNGENGYVLDQPNATTLATAIEELLLQPERLKIMSDLARQRVRVDLTWDAVAKNMLTTLDHI